MIDVDEALHAVDEGWAGYTEAEILAREVADYRALVTRLRARVAELEASTQASAS